LTSLKFRPDVLMAAREVMGLNQLQLATLAEEASHSTSGPLDDLGTSERVRRVRTWQSRIGAWERGIDSPSAAHVPMLARLVDVSPLAFYDVDPGAPSFTALRFAAGMTLQGLATATGISYTSLHRMLRGVTELSPDSVDRLSAALGAKPTEIVAAVDRDR
jgi:transcriptional regulator with XRE-family HTH domain